MMSTKHIVFLTVVILLTLLLRDLPHFNVIIINKIWLLYLVLLLVILLMSMKFQVSRLTIVTVLLFFASLVLTLWGFTFFAEAVGSLIYFSLWIILVYNIVTFLKEIHP